MNATPPAELAQSALDEAVRSAREAFAAAADLDELAAVKPTHLGDGSPVLRARRMIGSLDAKDRAAAGKRVNEARQAIQSAYRSEEHTSELQSRENLVCRL